MHGVSQAGSSPRVARLFLLCCGLLTCATYPATAQSLAPAKGPRNITFGPDGLVIADQSSGLSQTEPGIAVNPSNPQNLVA